MFIINRNYFMYYSVVFSAIIMGAMLKIELISTFVCALVFIIMAIKQRKRKINDIILFGYILLCFQNLLIGFGSHLGQNTGKQLSYLTQIPTLFIYIIGMVAILKKTKWDKIDFVSIIIIAILCVEMVTSNASFFAKSVYFRNCSIFYFAYMMGRHYVQEIDEEFINQIIKINICIILIGIIMYFLPVEFWNSIGMREIFIAKNAGESFYETGFPIRFYTSIGNFRTMRMASFVFEPINLNYMLTTSMILLLAKPYLNVVEKKQFIILLIGAILTFAKGGFLILVILVLFKVIMNHNDNKIKKFFSFRVKVAICFVIFIIGVYFLGKFYMNRFGGSAMAHFKSIINTVTDIMRGNFTARGLGRGGNYGEHISSSYASGGESGLMAIVVQMGIPFTLLFIIDFIMISIKSTSAILGKNKIIGGIPLSIIIVCVFQENTLGPQCCFLLMAIVGMSIGAGKEVRMSYEKNMSISGNDKTKSLLFRKG